jgi:hypothetical protein
MADYIQSNNKGKRSSRAAPAHGNMHLNALSLGLMEGAKARIAAFVKINPEHGRTWVLSHCALLSCAI